LRAGGAPGTIPVVSSSAAIAVLLVALVARSAGQMTWATVVGLLLGALMLLAIEQRRRSRCR
jgi:hypothetical protein